MSVTYHKYLGKTEMPPPETKPRGNGQSAKEKLDRQWRQERIAHERSKRALAEAKLARAKGELIPHELVQKQAAFLVLSLRARLLALAGEHARELLNVSDEREMTRRLDTIMRGTLDAIANMPEKVSDPDWMARLAEEGDE